MRVTAHTVLARPQHVIWREVDGEGILLNLEDGFYYGVNPVALSIWKGIDGKQTLSRLASSLPQSYAVEGSAALSDTVRWASVLVKRNLLTVAA